MKLAENTHVISKEESDEQQMMPYDQNLAAIRAEEESDGADPGDVPADENFVDDDVVEEGEHTT